ncbi:MAG: alpha-mannosyltransferase [Chlamydiia bacterium]|nr:alpha-mannosyltransferase [Chlamydiia bacterium]
MIDSSIPKKIHFTYRTKKLPKVYQTNLSLWKKMCPDWTIHYYSNEDVYKFFNTYFPEYSNEIAQIEMGVVLSDLFRYGVLYIYGGMYTDCDTFPVREIPSDWLSFDSVIGYEYQPKKHRCKNIPSYQEDTLCQWTLLSKPKYPLFKEVLDQSILKLKERNFQFRYGTDILETTGPIHFTQVAKKYLEDPNILILDMDVFAPKSMINPTLQNNVVFHQYHGSAGWKLEVALPQLRFE